MVLVCSTVRLFVVQVATDATYVPLGVSSIVFVFDFGTAAKKDEIIPWKDCPVVAGDI